MNSRQRVQAALRHQAPDRPPLDLGSTNVTGISASTYAKLRRALGLPESRVRVVEPFMMLADMDDDVRDAVGIDTVGLRLPKTFFGFVNENWQPWTMFDGTEVLVAGQFNVREAANGDMLLHPKGDASAPPSGRMPQGGYYFDVIVRQQPIDWDHLDPDEWVKEMYAVYSDEDLRFLQDRADHLHHTSERALICSLVGGGFGDIAVVPGPVLAHPKGIRDPQDWIVAHATHPEYIKGIYERQCEIALENARLLWQAVGSKLDVVQVSGTDFGTQDRLFISPDMYRELYKPFHQRVNDWIHRNTTWKVFLHSCGSVVGIIDDFIDAGVDILNPVQTSAKGMDPRLLKDTYGDRLVFWGGGVDTQFTLPFGTPDEVYAQARERISILNRNGGFVFTPVHNVQQGVPAANLLAMFSAIKDAIKDAG